MVIRLSHYNYPEATKRNPFLVDITPCSKLNVDSIEKSLNKIY